MAIRILCLDLHHLVIIHPQHGHGHSCAPFVPNGGHATLDRDYSSPDRLPARSHHHRRLRHCKGTINICVSTPFPKQIVTFKSGFLPSLIPDHEDCVVHEENAIIFGNEAQIAAARFATSTPSRNRLEARLRVWSSRERGSLHKTLGLAQDFLFFLFNFTK